MPKRLKKLNEGKVTDWRGFLDEFRSESDRVTAIIGAAFLDGHLRLLLKQFLVDDDVTSELVGEDEGYAPLSAFGARITAAYALGLLGIAELHDLRIIKELRNAFAHGLQGLSFSHPDIEAECAKLKAPDAHPHAETVQSARERFVLTVELLANQIALRGNDAMRERRVIPSDYPIAKLFFTSQ